MRRTSADAGSGRSIHAFEPGVDLALGIVLGNAVALLKPARKLGALALDHIEVVVGELAPLLLNLAFELFPVAFDAIPIHGFLLFLSSCGFPSWRKNRGARTKVPIRGTCLTHRGLRKRQGRSRQMSTTPEITGRARGGGNGRPAAKTMHGAPLGSCGRPAPHRLKSCPRVPRWPPPRSPDIGETLSSSMG